jgi:hypothetical protein
METKIDKEMDREREETRHSNLDERKYKLEIETKREDEMEREREETRHGK